MEARLAKLEGLYEGIEKRLSMLEGDSRKHLYFSIASFAALLGVMAKGFGWL